MSALRLARAVTRRDRVIKFAGCYHGHVDALLASAGSGVMTLGIPSTPGVPSGVAADTIVVPFNDVDGRRGRRASATARASPRSSSSPWPGTWASSRPRPATSRRCGRSADATGALLVFDEVITGFRVARGGAQERYGVTPDLTVLGKIVGGGLPAAAFGGRADLMERLAPERRRLPGRHALGEPARDRCRRLRPAPAARPGGLRAARGDAAPRLEAGLAPFGTRPARRRDADALLPRRPGARLRRCRRVRHRAVRRALPAPARAPASTSRRRSSSACSSRSRTATRRSTATVDAVASLLRRTERRALRGDRRRARPRRARSGGSRCARRRSARRREPVFSPLVPDPALALGLETIYEGYLLHYGRSRLFDPADDDVAILLGDYLLRPRPRAGRGDRRSSAAVGDLAELISLCAQARADGP